MPPQKTIHRGPLESPLILHFTQKLRGMIQLTCLMDGGRGGWQWTPKWLWAPLEKSSLKLTLFLYLQIIHKILTIIAIMRSYNRGLQLLLHVSIRVSKFEISRGIPSKEDKQFQYYIWEGNARTMCNSFMTYNWMKLSQGFELWLFFLVQKLDL
jgi:hypothetical protein